MTTTEERFWAKVGKTDGCWHWLGPKSPEGYGRFSVDGRLVGPHRFAYELVVGPLPEGLELDHLCRNPSCVKPSHVEIVSHVENVRRGHAGRNWAAKIHCPQGHSYNLFNTRFRPRNGKRVTRTCRECRRIEQRSRRYRTRQEKLVRTIRVTMPEGTAKE